MAKSGPGQPDPTSGISRRRFLGAAAAAAGGSLAGTRWARARQITGRVPPTATRSRVIRIRNAHAVDGPTVHLQLVSEMLERALTTLTDAPTLSEAWQTLLRPKDVVGLKFNRSGQRVLGTTETVATVVVSSLVKAGFPATRIVCIEAPKGLAERLGTTRAWSGFDRSATDFGSGADQLASVVRQVNALIDIPFLKNHNIAGMTCALKNLSHGLIKHPARYHANNCSPFIADIVANTPIAGKLRLCLVDALRVVYDRGPEAAADTISDTGMLLASTDPVATDLVGLSFLNEVRAGQGLPAIVAPTSESGYLSVAHERRLGMATWHNIELMRVQG